nr:HIT domain-containing protein [Myroides odoratus]
MKDFTQIPQERFLYKDDYFLIIKDIFPVSPNHLLIRIL